MRDKTNDVTNTEQEMKEKATNKVTREDGNSPQYLNFVKKFCKSFLLTKIIKTSSI